MLGVVRDHKTCARCGRHTSINVTLNTYGHLFPDAFADVGPALDRLVETGRGEAHVDIALGR